MNCPLIKVEKRCIMKLIPLLLTFVVTATVCAQEANPKPPAESPRPSSRTRPPAVVSPELHPDRSVTFRLRATNAAEVKLSGEWTRTAIPLQKDDDGVWATKVGPLEPDVYGYNFTVDGV